MERSINQTTLMCPSCTSTLLSANKRGFNGTRAALGILYSPLGLTLGMKGMSDIEITCLQCGTTFKPGEGAVSIEEVEQKKKELDERKSAEASNKRERYFVAILLIAVTCACLCAYFISLD